MSTTATATPAKSSPFGFKSLGHFFSTAFSDLKKATAYAASTALPTTQKVIEEAETVTQDLAPFIPQASEALVIERTLDAAAGELLAAVNSAQVAEGSNLVNVQLDATTVQQFKQFIADQKAALSKLGYSL